MKDTSFCHDIRLELKHRSFHWNRPLVMGILNITPDSFFSGSRVDNQNVLQVRSAEMIMHGVDILDIGGYSSRPGAQDVSEEEEIERLVPAIEFVRKLHSDILISADTFRPNVARMAILAGADIINDISGGTDPRLLDFVANANAGYVLMHMRGTPQTMQSLAVYENLCEEIVDFFSYRITFLKRNGVNNVIIDPGFGFAKTIEHSFELLRNLKLLTISGYPLLVGLSRKSMIYKPLGITPEESLPSTSALHLFALLNGAGILRVHDVAEARQVVDMAQRLI